MGNQSRISHPKHPRNGVPGYIPAALGVFAKRRFGRHPRHGRSLVCVLGENTKRGEKSTAIISVFLCRPEYPSLVILFPNHSGSVPSARRLCVFSDVMIQYAQRANAQGTRTWHGSRVVREQDDKAWDGYSGPKHPRSGVPGYIKKPPRWLGMAQNECGRNKDDGAKTCKVSKTL